MRVWVQIDFAKPAWYSIKHITWLGTSIFLMSILLAFSAYGYLHLQQLHQPALPKSPVPPKLSVPVVEIPTPIGSVLSQAQIQILSSTVDQLNAPWDSLLVALESMLSPDVALISILPNHHKQILELTGEARNIPAMLSYLESLEALAMLEHVTLQKHEINETHSYQPVEFVILARWQ